MENMGLVDELRQTYRGKKVLLTGHTGFKGSWLLSLLYELGAKVKGYALAPESNSLYQQLNGDAYCDSVIQDIKDDVKLKNEIHSFQPDFVFHLAAQALVRPSYEFPVITFETNIMGTVNVLEAVRQMKGKCVVIIITTDKVYLNLESGKPFNEGDPLGGHDPYSASKAAAEILISSYQNSFFAHHQYDQHQKSISSARAGNVIGGGDWSMDRLIPDIIRSVSVRKPIVIRNPKAIRPWQHVLEPLIGYLLLGMKQFHEPLRYNEAWNFGPGEDHEKSVEEIARIVIQLWGSGELAIVPDESKPEANLLRLNVNKAKQLGWQSTMSIEETLGWTVDWYSRVAHGEDARLVQMEQINTFLKLL